MKFPAAACGFTITADWTDETGVRRLQLAYGTVTARVIVLDVNGRPPAGQAYALARWIGHCAGRRYSNKEATDMLTSLMQQTPTRTPRTIP